MKPSRETCGKITRLPSGPLHDAAEVARAGVPTVMMFVQSLHGISHNKIEDTKEEHLEMCVTAFDKLAEKAIRWITLMSCLSVKRWRCLFWCRRHTRFQKAAVLSHLVRYCSPARRSLCPCPAIPLHRDYFRTADPAETTTSTRKSSIPLFGA